MKVAFVDIDHCLVSVNTSLEFTKHLLKNGYHSPWRFIPLTVLYFLFQFKLFPQAWLIQLYVLSLKGSNLESLRKIACDFTRERIAPTLILSVIEEIKELQRQGFRIVLATGSFELTATPLGQLIGADDVLATGLSEKKGLLTGGLRGVLLYGADKWRAVREFATANRVDLAQSSAYSDHSSDLPLLEAVGSPVAVNPDRKLRRLAKKRGWRLIETGQ